MKDLSNPFWIKLKGLLFLLIGIAAAVLVFLDNRNGRPPFCSHCASGASAGFTISPFTSSKNTLTQVTNFPG